MESTPNLSSSSGGIPSAGPSCQILPPLSIGSGNYDRAWNDPPVFSLEVNGMAKPIPTKLTKRVAYPAGGVSSGTAVTPLGPSPPLPPGPQNLPGLLTIIPPTKVDFIPSFPSPGSTPDEDEGQSQSVSGNKLVGGAAEGGVSGTKEDAHVGCKRRLLTLLEESLSREPYLEDSVAAEVRKRLEILDLKWEVLPTEVQVKLNDLGTCLEAKDYQGADSIQLNLSAKFMSQCGPWIMALKQIIRKHLE